MDRNQPTTGQLGRVTPVALLVGLILVPLSASVSVDDGFRAVGTVRLDGMVQSALDAEEASLDAEHALNLTIDAPGATVRLVRVQTLLVTQRDPLGNEIGGENPFREEVLLDWTLEGPLRIGLEPGGGAVALPAEERFHIETNATGAGLEPLGARVPRDTDDAFGMIPNVDGRPTSTRDPHTHTRLHGPLGTLDGGILLATGGHIVFDNGTVLEAPGRHRNEDLSFRDPVTGSGEDVYEADVLVVSAGRMRVDGFAPWNVAATQLDAVLDGRIEWRGVVGGVSVDGDVSDDPNVLEMQGRFDLSGDLTPGGGWTVRGEASRVAIDLRPVFGVDAEAFVGGLTVVGVVVAVLAYGRDLLAIAVGRLTEPLTSRTRQEILRVVHERQPVTLPQLRDATGLARGTLRYHLRVLSAAHILQSVVHGGRGRNATYVLNGGSLMFKAGALDADADSHSTAGEALSAAATHPVRRAVFEHLMERGPTAAGELRFVADPSKPLTASALSYHLRVLTEAGLIRRRALRGGKFYEACIDVREAASRQYERYLHRKDWMDAVRILHDSGPMGPDSLAAALVGAGHARRRADAAVESLRRLAVLEPTDDGLRVHPSVVRALSPRGAS